MIKWPRNAGGSFGADTVSTVSANVDPGEPMPTPQPGIVSKVAEFISVVSGPKVSSEVFESRLAICKGCKYMREEDGKMYCGRCGCGKWRMAELTNKLKWARLECADSPPRFLAVEVS